MKPQRNSVGLIRKFFGVFPFIVGACAPQSVFTPGEEEVLFRDDFSGVLKEGWVLDGSNSDVNMSETPGVLTLFPPDVIPDGEQAATTILFRELDGDFVVVTKLDFQTITDLQSSGLVIQGDDGRTVVLGVTKVDQFGFRGVLMLADHGPGTQRGRAATNSDLETVFLRVVRSGDRYTGSLSPDGIAFTAVGSLSNDLSTTVNVGVGTLIAEACSSNCNERVPVEYDFFEIRTPAP